MRRPITLALLLVAAGTLSAVAATAPRQQVDPDVRFAANAEKTDFGLKARLSAGATLERVMLDFPEVGESLELQVMQRVGEEGLPLSEAKTLITGVDAAAKNAVMPVRLFVDGELVAEGRVRVADPDQSYLIVTHGETGSSLELIQP